MDIYAYWSRTGIPGADACSACSCYFCRLLCIHICGIWSSSHLHRQLDVPCSSLYWGTASHKCRKSAVFLFRVYCQHGPANSSCEHRMLHNRPLCIHTLSPKNKKILFALYDKTPFLIAFDMSRKATIYLRQDAVTRGCDVGSCWWRAAHRFGTCTCTLRARAFDVPSDQSQTWTLCHMPCIL